MPRVAATATIVASIAVALSLTAAEPQFFAFRDDNTNGCPPKTERPDYECQGQYSTCWSPGVRDLDCPGQGYCCFDGCAATCLAGSEKPYKPVKKPVVVAYPKPAPLKEYPPPLPPPTTPKPEYRHFPKRTAQHYPVHPAIGRKVVTKCSVAPPRSQYECAGHSGDTCWSPGHPDTDCPGHGLCCFDGCGNTCAGHVHVVPPPLPLPPPRTPKNPCLPHPCGPHTTCTVNVDSNAVCQCEPGFVPKPDTITGCDYECYTDPDCSYGEVCQSHRCVEKPDPCYPSPCGPGTTCKPDRAGNSICHCLPGLIPKPDTITGCGPECQIDPDCRYGNVCRNQKCVEKPDPCDPSPCGPRTTCEVNRAGNPICHCLPGYVPKPDTITGCGPECVIDTDCRTGYICEGQKCVEKPDPCYPSPCGPGATCRMGPYDNAICECEPGLIPKPDTVTGCGPECIIDDDCYTGYICQSQRCVERPDPCDPSPCGPGTTCEVNHQGNPICRCQPGLVPMPDTIVGCGPECTQDRDCFSNRQFGDNFLCQQQRCVEKPDPCDPSPCGPGTRCEVNRLGNSICHCLAGLIPKPDTITGCGPECESDYDCQQGYQCLNQKCVEKPDPCNPNPCGMMATCTPRGYDNYDCECPRGTFGDPYAGCIEGECQSDEDCDLEKACIDYYCMNPCLTNSTCRAQDFCQVRNHVPVCGFNQKITQEPRTPIVIGGRYNVEGPPEPRGFPVVIGATHGGGRRPGGFGGGGGGLSLGDLAEVTEGRRRTSGQGSARVLGSRYRRRRRRRELINFLQRNHE